MTTNRPPVLMLQRLKQWVCLFQIDVNGKHKWQYIPLTAKGSSLCGVPHRQSRQMCTGTYRMFCTNDLVCRLSRLLLFLWFCYFLCCYSCSVCVCAREAAAKRCSDSGVTGEAFLLRLHHSFVLPVIVSAFITSTAPSHCLPCGLAVSLSRCLLNSSTLCANPKSRITHTTSFATHFLWESPQL